MAAMAIWLILLLLLAAWYQKHYIQSFTQLTPDFLDSQFSEHWLNDLSKLLPTKTTKSRIIQFWQPNCLCNRFAKRHAINTMNTAKDLGVEHITIIPSNTDADIKELQKLNPNTHIIQMSTQQLTHWPAAPSVFIQGALNQLVYFGPLGYGAFCSQSSANVIESQLKLSQKDLSKPFFNVIGKGCFCGWGA